MIERVNEDIKSAMKAKEKGRLDALRMLKSSLMENKTSKKPKDEADVCISHVKKLKDAMESFPKGSEEILKLQAEVDHLKDYVPSPLTKDDVTKLVEDFVKGNEGANFGAVMKFISPKIKGRFDGREASELVKSVLG